MEKRVIKGVKAIIPGKSDYYDIVIENGIISEVRKSSSISALTAIPGFIDTHIHGFAGYGTEDASEEAILKMSENLIKYGITSFFPTIYTDTLDRIEKDIVAIKNAVGKEKGARIRGIHIEGPFISPKRIGAQNPEGQRNPDKDLFLHFLSLAPGLIKAMTAAPELKGFESLLEAAKENGVVLLAGHTDATFDDMKRAHEHGLMHATHLFNAMKGLHHREPGTVGAIYSFPDMNTEIIMDGLHVHPEVVKLTLKIKGVDKVIAITDSLRPTEQVEGEREANGVPVVLRNGLWVTKGREDLIQGSSLTMYKAFLNLLSWGATVEDAVMLTSENAASLYSLDDVGRIEVGKKADIVLLNADNTINEVIRG